MASGAIPQISGRGMNKDAHTRSPSLKNLILLLGARSANQNQIKTRQKESSSMEQFSNRTPVNDNTVLTGPLAAEEDTPLLYIKIYNIEE
ncbi:hypothetical protein TNIN_146901 [Trichonephila inaurata madagascariensis]|uniref:Uncharacterized protein n=1 Tax=Trichonephila inaurata madagascariensis TaxID=2747483 RepID=A0A8X6XF71_9ARAC|nr:hypothetical protein TNIN_146901 [Trichonephila inaurata madagascariensis]